MRSCSSGENSSRAPDLRSQLRRLPPVQPTERNRTNPSLSGPRRRKFRTAGNHQQDRLIVQSAYDAIDEFERTGVGPMRVFEQHQQRRLLRRIEEPPAQGVESFLLALLRRQIEARIALPARDRQHFGDSREILG